ncbi:MAG: InlB B-repeat-containing protein, partial [Bacilli bacterium]|nr:InlB B-repeat-containing protein [Bacilli bacterium]
TIDESSSWIVTVSDGLYTVTNVAAQTRVLQFNNRFACYTTNQTKVVFIEKNDDPVVSISTTDSKVYLGGTLTFEEAVVHIEEPYDVNWSSTDETVATIDSNGVLHPVSIGVTTIKATIGVTESNGVNIVVLPNPSNPITVEQALAIAEATGESYTTDSFTTSGTLTYVNTSTITITDNTGTISVYKYNHGYTNENDGIKVQVEGKIINYNGTTKQFGSAVTISILYTVTFNPDNGEMITTVEVVSGETVNCSTPNPTKDGYEFVCWKDGGNEWNFSTPITSDKELTAYWNELLAYAHLDFQAMTTVASLKVDYNTVSGAQILTDSFVGTKSSSKVLPENWSGSVGGTYGTNFWQSFRDVNQYIQSPEFGEAQSGVIVTFNYFLNNYGSSGNKSTKLQFIALDSLDNPILTVLSSELNVNETGIANAKTLIISLSATGIKKIKIVMIKDGGGNIAFSTVTVNSATYELQKNQSDKNLVSIRYAGLISSSLRDRLLAEGSVVTFGMIYGAASSFDSHSADEICGLLNAGSLDSSDLTTMGIRMRGIELVGVNSTGTQEVPNNPEYYQFGISINNFSDANLATLYQGAAYVCIDGVYYAMSDRTFSIYTLAKAYAEAGDTSSYAEHLGILNTLAALAN